MGIQGMPRCSKCGTWCDRRNGSCGNEAPKPAPAADPQQSASSAQGEDEAVSEIAQGSTAECTMEVIRAARAGFRIGAERERTLGSIVAPAVAKENEKLRSDLALAREALELASRVFLATGQIGAMKDMREALDKTARKP